MQAKNCSVCNTSFFCHSSDTGFACWCGQFPALLSPESGQDCFCPECFKKRINDKIDQLIKTKNTEELLTIAGKYSGKDNLIEGIDYYMEKGFWVFTTWYHLQRGYCCNRGCRHCPYKPTV